MRCGTPVTMSPEVAKGKKYSFSPDWWAYGIIIYQLMNKTDPYKKPTVDELLDSIANDNWKFTSEAIENYSPELIDFVTKLLEKDPAQRLGTETGIKQIFAHPVFQREIISSDKVYLKPDRYNTNQDFLVIKHRASVAAEVYDISDYLNELAKE